MTISIVGSRRYVGCLDIVSFYDSARQDRMYFRVECEGNILANYLPYPEDAEKRAWSIFYDQRTCRTCTPAPPAPGGWYIKNISVSDKTIKFYVGVTGESWSIVLKNSSGAVEASTSGRSYGDHSLTATSYGMHTLELTCNWNIKNPCEVDSVTVQAPLPPPCNPNWVCESPLNGYEKDGCGNRRAATRCNPAPPPCTPNWVCETPRNGYEKDGCGNRRAATRCNPTTPPPVSKPTDYTMLIAATVVIVVLLFMFGRK